MSGDTVKVAGVIARLESFPGVQARRINERYLAPGLGGAILEQLPRGRKRRVNSDHKRDAPAVRRITPMPSGTSSSCAISLSRERSSGLVILRLMPPPRAVLGISTE